MKYRFFSIILVLAMSFTLCLTGCGTSSGDSSAAGSGNAPASSSAMVMVGIAMGSEETCGADGEAIKNGLDDAGFSVELAYADSSSAQSSQLSAMVDDGASVLIVNAVDAAAAAKTLESVTVDVSNVTVIAYRNEIDSNTVDVFVGRNYYEMGQQEAQHLVERLDLDNATAPVNIELITGMEDSEQAFQGAMDVLQPYIDAGTVTIPSGNTTADACQTGDVAAWAANMFSGTYASQELHGVLCLGDGQAVALVDSVLASYSGTIYPVITGADCTADTLRYMSHNLLDMVSISSGEEGLSAKAVEAVQNTLSSTGSAEDYLLPNTAVTFETYRELLVDSGAYTANDDGTFTQN